ncbi:MAG TPA: flavin reductase family protein [Gemmatimonadales bacterium]|nr:flavin reductase family protein [Gemmatimonadales bacterium]
MPLDEAAFRRTMSQLATGVTVVTVRVARGRAVGMTASSVTSLSLAPPMLLVCVGRDSEIHDVLLEAERFGVNVLGADQIELARRFADRDRQLLEERELVASPGGAPLIPHSLARIECRRRGQLDGGDHTIVTGTLEWSEVSEGRPLCYFGGRYAELAR